MRGLSTALLVGLFLLLGASAVSAAPSQGDTQYFWRKSSGPAGERDPTALALYEAIFEHDGGKTLQLLDKQKSSPNALLYPGRWSPLMVAVAYQDKDITRLSLSRGANINYVSDDVATYTALGVALNTARAETLERGSNPARIDFSMFYYLLDAGADPNVEFGYQQDIAFKAATVNQYGVLNELLRKGYHRDLPGLRRWIEIGQVNRETQPAKDQSIATIDRLLKRN